MRGGSLADEKIHEEGNIAPKRILQDQKASKIILKTKIQDDRKKVTTDFCRHPTVEYKGLRSLIVIGMVQW